MNKRLRTTIQYIFFLGLGIFLVWWSIKDLSSDDRSQIRSALKHARYYLIVPVFIVLMSSHLVRAIRWRLLIEPLGYKPSLKNTFFAVMIGYLANQAVPRLGEVLKCTALARYERVPADKLIGTMILERAIDAITLLCIFGITLAIQPDIYSQLIHTFTGGSSSDPDKKKIPLYIIAAIGIGAVLLATLLWMLIKKKTVSDVRDLILKIIKRVWQGFITIIYMKKRVRFFLLTILLWSLYLLGGYIGFKALEETSPYGIREAFSILSAGSIGMIITPGGIGAYAVLIQKTMQLYGLNEGIALAFGWILWLVQTGVILIGGVFSLLALPYYNRKKLRQQLL